MALVPAEPGWLVAERNVITGAIELVPVQFWLGIGDVQGGGAAMVRVLPLVLRDGAFIPSMGKVQRAE